MTQKFFQCFSLIIDEFLRYDIGSMQNTNMSVTAT